MVRKSKEDADKTRQQLIDAARECFLKFGVAGTTLDVVAKHAGLTRGAVYWHFENKFDLFMAVRDEVILPLFDPCAEEQLSLEQPDPLGCLHNYLTTIVETLFRDKKVVEVLHILIFKCEYVGDFEAALTIQREHHQRLLETFSTLFAKAKSMAQTHLQLDTDAAAFDTQVFLVGLVRLIVMNNALPSARLATLKSVDHHVARYRLTAPA